MLFCPSCTGALPSWMARDGHTVCPHCYRDTEVHVFPAFFRREEAPAPATAAEGEARCYEHASRKAETACSQCGRFVCSLCQVDLGGQSWCPDCLEGAKTRKADNKLENRRTLYDSMTLAMAALPLLTIYFWFLTWPIPIYLSVRHWKTPSSIVPRNKWRFIVALLIAVAELCGLAFIVIAIIYASRQRLHVAR